MEAARAFREAAASSDIEPVEKYFAQRSVAENALSVEAWLVRNKIRRLGDCVYELRRDVHEPWLVSSYSVNWEMLMALGEPLEGNRCLLDGLASTVFGQSIPRTLALLLGSLVQEAIKFSPDPLQLEVLLGSRLFTDSLNPEEQLDVLSGPLQSTLEFTTHEVLSVLVAHGLDLHTYPPTFEYHSIEPVEALADFGAVVVGFDGALAARVSLDVAEDYTRAMIRLGADPRVTGPKAWQHQIRDGGTGCIPFRPYCEWRLWVEVAIEEGFVDVDARRGDGLTPLMVAVILKNGSLVRKLLDHNADATLMDTIGETALTKARCRGPELQQIILEYGYAAQSVESLANK